MYITMPLFGFIEISSHVSRHALEDCIQSKITVLLAGIIAYADKNRNLDLLTEANEDSWLYKFWIRMFLDPNLTGPSYR